MEQWFSSLIKTADDMPRVLIAPHAGYFYSGACAASAFHQLKPDASVLLLHPSHYAQLSKLKQTPFKAVATPIGNIKVVHVPNIDYNMESIDLKEHSGELHFPMLKYARVKSVSVIMVGQSWDDEGMNALKQFITKDTVIVVSSDFCHYGPDYSFCPNLPLPLHQSIKKMDLDSYGYIRANDVSGFEGYLRDSGNTVCGRSPIILAMELLKGEDVEWRLADYAQSKAAQSQCDNSVSYLSAVGYAREWS